MKPPTALRESSTEEDEEAEGHEEDEEAEGEVEEDCDEVGRSEERRRR
jgi:hypothetical protein